VTRLWLSAAWSAAQRALLGMIEGIRQMVTDWQRICCQCSTKRKLRGPAAFHMTAGSRLT
jgi:hypothetical protein